MHSVDKMKIFLMLKVVVIITTSVLSCVNAQITPGRERDINKTE
jgi:hypothetical protein